jgi:hypothetical protein
MSRMMDDPRKPDQGSEVVYDAAAETRVDNPAPARDAEPAPTLASSEGGCHAGAETMRAAAEVRRQVRGAGALRAGLSAGSA